MARTKQQRVHQVARKSTGGRPVPPIHAKLLAKTSRNSKSGGKRVSASPTGDVKKKPYRYRYNFSLVVCLFVFAS